jgi:N6-adenosine-specific RNA methylase IME4
MKKYQIIYADPPWKFKVWSEKNYSKIRPLHYKRMNLEDIKNLCIPTEKNCILFLWTTMPTIKEALEVIEAWGFQFKTVAFTWVKRNKKSSSWFWGMGYWTRANAELCLLATKGNPKRISAGVHSVIDTPVERHSQKPADTRNRIVELMGDLPRIELFARQKTEGWDVWGNEVESDINLGEKS